MRRFPLGGWEPGSVEETDAFKRIAADAELLQQEHSPRIEVRDVPSLLSLLSGVKGPQHKRHFGCHCLVVRGSYWFLPTCSLQEGVQIAKPPIQNHRSMWRSYQSPDASQVPSSARERDAMALVKKANEEGRLAKSCQMHPASGVRSCQSSEGGGKGNPVSGVNKYYPAHVRRREVCFHVRQFCLGGCTLSALLTQGGNITNNAMSGMWVSFAHVCPWPRQ